MVQGFKWEQLFEWGSLRGLFDFPEGFWQAHFPFCTAVVQGN